MYHTDAATRRRTPRRRLARWALAALTVGLVAAGCTHHRPPAEPPTTTTAPKTTTTRIVCPLSTDGASAEAAAPLRPCPPICPLYDAPADQSPTFAPPRCPCPLTADTVIPCRPCPPGPVATDAICPCVATSPANDMIPCPVKPPGTGIPGLLSTKDFNAWVNAMPGGPRQLIVTGTLVFNMAGYKAKLVAASPQGINPRILALDLVVTPPSGPVAQVITEQQVRFEYSFTDYDSVSVRNLGLNLPVTIAW